MSQYDQLPVDGDSWPSKDLRKVTNRVVAELEKTPLTRKQLGKKLRVSRTTLGRALTGLLAGNFIVTQVKAPSGRVGRPVEVLSFNPLEVYAIGIDVTRRFASGVAVDRAFRVIASENMSLQNSNSWVNAPLELCRRLKSNIELQGASYKNLLGVGVGVPIPAGGQNQENDCQLGQIVKGVSAQWQSSVLIDNTVRMVAKGELRPGIDDLIYVTLDRGVGACVISARETIRGSRSLAGELGHCAVKGEQRPCHCGQYGCLETVIGTKSLLKDSGCRNLEELVGQKHKPQIKKLIDYAASCVADILLPVVLMTAPAEIVIGGILTHYLPEIATAIAGKLNSQLPPILNWQISVRPAEHDVNERAWGAIAALCNQ